MLPTWKCVARPDMGMLVAAALIVSTVEAPATVALDEERFFNPDAVATSEVSGALKGHKTRVLDVGQCSRIFCVAERASGERGIAMFAPSAEGVTIGSRRMMDLHSADSIQLDGLNKTRCHGFGATIWKCTSFFGEPNR